MARPEFEVPEFVSESDSDQIQERMMGNLPADISDMEGDFPYDFTMPTAIEISQLVQFNLVRCLMVAFPEYSWGDWMDLHGAEAGAVSYTHLYHVEEVAVDLSENSGDIYKVNRIPTGKKDGKGKETVSYTHLDVYKRQPQC